MALEEGSGRDETGAEGRGDGMSPEEAMIEQLVEKLENTLDTAIKKVCRHGNLLRLALSAYPLSIHSHPERENSYCAWTTPAHVRSPRSSLPWTALMRLLVCACSRFPPF